MKSKLKKKISIFLREMGRKASILGMATAVLLSNSQMTIELLAETRDKTPPILANSTFSKAGNEGFIDAKTNIVSDDISPKMTVRLTPQFQSGSAQKARVHVYLPSFKYVNGDIKQTTPDEAPTGMGIRGKLILDDDWDIIGEQTVDGGWLVAEYVGSITGGSNNGIQVELSTYTDPDSEQYKLIPERTTAALHSYVSYESFNSAANSQWESPKKYDENSVVNLILTNLTWETSITANIDEVIYPWDRYNYGEVTVKVNNTSDNEASNIEQYRMSLDIDSTLEGYNGIIPEDITRWIYNEGGEPTFNEEYEDETGDTLYVGVPGEGGIIIYDKTDWDGEEELTPIPYTYSNGGMIFFERNYNESDIVKPDKALGENEKSEREFEIHIPYASEGFPDRPALNRILLTTEILFGSDQYWTKSDSVAFEIANPTFDGEVEKAAVNKTVVYDQTGTYKLFGFKNLSDIPVFNPTIIDTIPSKAQGFDFKGVKIVSKEDNLLEEFNEDVLEYDLPEPGSPDPKTVSVTASQFTSEYDEETEEYTYTYEGINNGFIGRELRINLKERFNVNEEQTADVLIYGKMTKLTTIKNNAYATYESWSSILKPVDDKKYEITDHETEIVDADITVTMPDPINPKLRQESRYEETIGSIVDTTYGEEASFNHYISNDSVTKIKDLNILVNINRLNADDGFFLRGDGITPTAIELDEGFIDNDDFNKLTISTMDKESYVFTLSGNKLISEDTDAEFILAGGSFVLNQKDIEELGLVNDLLIERSNFISEEEINYLTIKGRATGKINTNYYSRTKLEAYEPKPFTGMKTLNSSSAWRIKADKDPINPTLRQESRYEETIGNILDTKFGEEASFNHYISNNSATKIKDLNISVNINRLNADDGLFLRGNGITPTAIELDEGFINNDDFNKLTISTLDKESYVFTLSGNKLISQDTDAEFILADGSFVLRQKDIEELGLVNDLLIERSDFISEEEINYLTIKGRATGKINTNYYSRAKLEAYEPKPFTEIQTLNSSSAWRIKADKEAINPVISQESRYNDQKGSLVDVPYGRRAEIVYSMNNDSPTPASKLSYTINLNRSKNDSGDYKKGSGLTPESITLNKELFTSGDFEGLVVSTIDGVKYEFTYKDNQLQNKDGFTLDVLEDGSFIFTDTMIKEMGLIDKLDISIDNFSPLEEFEAVSIKGIVLSRMGSTYTSNSLLQASQPHPFEGLIKKSASSGIRVATADTSIRLRAKQRAISDHSSNTDWDQEIFFRRGNYTDSTLDMGYKTIASYTQDITRPTNKTQNVKTKLITEINLPHKNFDSYYVKIDKKVEPYIDTINIYRTNARGVEELWSTFNGGASAEGSDWVSNANSRSGKESDNFWRINTARPNSEDYFGNHSDLDLEDHPYYKNPFDETVRPTNPVSRVEVVYNFNQDEADQHKAPELPGTTNDAVEVTGRLYQASTSRFSTTTVLNSELGEEQKIKTTSSSSISTNVMDTRAATRTGAHVSLATNRYTIANGRTGDFLINLENYATPGGGVYYRYPDSGNNYNEWTRRFGVNIGMMDELLYTFRYPTQNPTNSEEYYYEADEIILGDKTVDNFKQLVINLTKGKAIVVDEHIETIKFIKTENRTTTYEDGVVSLADGAHPTTLQLHLININGIGDNSAEYEGVKPNRLDPNTTTDLRVTGMVVGNRDLTATSTIENLSEGRSQSAVFAQSNATLRGKTLAFSTNVDITGIENSDKIYDYKENGIDVNNAKYGFDFENRGEANADNITMTINPDANFRTKDITIPSAIFKSDKWDVSEVIVKSGTTNKNVKDYFIEDEELGVYVLDLESLFSDGVLPKVITTSINNYIEYREDRVDTITISFSPTEGNVLSGSFDGEEGENILYPDGHDVVISGNWVDKSLETNDYDKDTRPSLRLTGASTRSFRVSTSTTTPDSYTNTKISTSSALISTNFNNRRIKLALESLLYSEYGNVVFEDGEAIIKNNIINGDRINYMVKIMNKGSLATEANGAGDLKVLSPVFEMKSLHGFNLDSWRLVNKNSQLDTNVESFVDSETDLSTIKPVLIDVKTNDRYELGDKLPSDLNEVRVEFLDHEIDYNDNLFIDFSLSASNNYPNKVYQNKALDLKSYARATIDPELYSVYRGTDSLDIEATTTRVALEKDKQLRNYSHNIITGLKQANPAAGKVEIEFVKENVSTSPAVITITDIKNKLLHSDTQLELLIKLDSNAPSGFVLTSVPDIKYPEGFVGEYDQPKVLYLKGGEYIEMTPESNFKEINEIKIDYGKLPSKVESATFFLDDVEIFGKGYFQDESKTNNQLSTIRPEVEFKYTHHHTDENKSVYTDTTFTEQKVLKAMPGLEFDIQSFDNYEDAQKAYSETSKLKDSFLEGDTIAYRITTKNKKVMENKQGGDPYGTAELEDPIIIDRIPEYLNHNISDYIIERDGKTYLDVKSARADGVLEIVRELDSVETYLDEVEVEIKTITSKDIGGSQSFAYNTTRTNGTGRLSPQQPVNTEVNPAKEIEFTEVVYKFADDLARGEQISIIYKTEARMTDLPKATYINDGEIESPVYAPFFGWYGDDSPTVKSQTQINEPMSMDSLHHEAGVTGSLSFEQQGSEFLNESTSYLQGEADSTGNYYGKPARVAKRHKVQLKENQGEKLHLVNTNRVSTMYSTLLSGRTDHELDNKVLWGNSVIRHRKAWLASQSEFLPKVEKGVNNIDDPANFYKEDKNMRPSGVFHGHSPYSADNYTYALELHEEFITRLTASNYGDKSIKGIEFIEVLPAGIEPIFNEEGLIDIKATIGSEMTSGNYQNKNDYNFVDIDESLVSYEVIQTPETLNPKYKAPKEFKRGDLTEEDYYETKIPYVIKVVVDGELSEWYNRGEALDISYMMRIDIPTVVVSENHDEAWYDQLFVKAIENDHNETHEIYGNTFGTYTASNFPRNQYDTHYVGKDAMNEGMNIERTYYAQGRNSHRNHSFEPYGNYASGGNNPLPFVREGKVAVSQDKLRLRKPTLRTAIRYGDLQEPSKHIAVDMYDKFTTHIDVNNIMMGDQYTHQRSNAGYNQYQNQDAFLYRSQTIGGARGSYISPVVTVIIPKGVKPVENEDGSLSNNVALTNYSNYDFIENSDLNAIANVTVSFDEELERYKYELDFKEEVFIKNLQGLRLSLDLEVYEYPEFNEGEALELSHEFDEFYVFASSEREVFKPIIESRFKAGSAVGGSTSGARSGSSVYNNDRSRYDSTGSLGKLYYPGKPALISEIKAYKESDEINIKTVPTRDDYILSEEFMTGLNGNDTQTIEVEGRIIEEGGVYSSARFYMKRPLIKTELKAQRLLADKPQNDLVLSPHARFFYSVNVDNNQKELLTSGKLFHSDIYINAHIPHYLELREEVVLRLYDKAGEETLITSDQFKANGLEVELLEDETANEEAGLNLVRFRIRLTDEQVHKLNFFDNNDQFTLNFEVQITRSKDDTEETADEAIWTGDDLIAQVYVEAADMSDELDGATAQPNYMIEYENQVIEKKDEINKDTVLKDRFTNDETQISIVKPRGQIRKNMVKPRELFSSGQIGDPYFSSSDDIEYIISQVNNTTAEVPRLIVEDILPTYEETFLQKLGRKITFGKWKSDKPIITDILNISTGNWEMPQAYLDEWAVLEPELDLEDEYRVYVYYSHESHVDDREFDKDDDAWVLLNEEGAKLTESTKLTFPRNQENNQIKRVRWVIESSDTTRYQIPKDFRLDIDASSELDGKQEVSEIDPENNSIDIYESGVINNAPKVVLKARPLKTATVYIYNNADLWLEFTEDIYALVGTSNTRAYLTPSRPVVDIVYNAQYFRYDRNREGDNKFAWDDILLVNPNISPHMKYKAIVTPSDDTMWSKEEDARYDEDTLIDPVIAFELPGNFTLDGDRLEFVDPEDIAGTALDPDYSSSTPLNDSKDSHKWTWYIERAEKNGQLSKVQIDENLTYDNPYVGSWDGLGNNLFRVNFKGLIYPGDSIVIEYSGRVDEYVPGSDKPQLRSRVNVLNNSGMLNPLNTELVTDRYLGYTLDRNDINNNGKVNDRIVSAQSQFFEFAGYNDFPKNKMVRSELNQAGTSEPELTPVPEGKDYRYSLTIGNPNPESGDKYKSPVIYDILPYEDDQSVTGYLGSGDEYIGSPRNSKWSGWFKSEGLELYKEDDGDQEALNKSEYDIYVGPFKKVGKEIEKLDMDQIPSLAERSKEDFYKQFNTSEAFRNKHTVKLDDIEKLKETDLEKYEDLMKHVKVVASVFTNKSTVLGSRTKYILEFDMQAPINTPAFVGTPQTSEDNPMNEVVKDFASWNSFAAWQDAAGYMPSESNTAGAYVSIPEDRAYIGDYIWIDENQNGLQDESARKGLNGVEVALMTKEGYPSNIDGQPVMELEINGKDEWVIVDTATGEPYIQDDFMEPVKTKAPYTFTSQNDINGESGYYILSNLKPDQYKLKFTFPTEYNRYGLTTPVVHDDVELTYYVVGEELPGVVGRDVEVAENLVVISDTFDLEAASVDKDFRDFDLGIYETVQYGGKAFMENGGEADGWYGDKGGDGKESDKDTPIEGYIARLHELNGDVVVNQRGIEMELITDKNGDYLFDHLKVDQNYYVSMSDENDEITEKVPVTPFIHSKLPLDNANDNNLYMSELDDDINIARTNEFITERPVNSDGELMLESNGRFPDVNRIYGGFVTLSQTSTIGNYVWHDLNRNGLQDRGEPGLPGVGVRLIKYIQIDGEWTPDSEFNNSPESRTFSDDKGFYYFPEVPTSDFIDGVEHINGYDLIIEEFPSGLTETLLQVRVGEIPTDTKYSDIDSDLRANGQLNAERIILSEPDDSSDTGFDTSVAKHNVNLDAGFVDFDLGTFAGLVFEDKNRNSIQDFRDDIIEGIEVGLQVKVNGAWKTVMINDLEEVLYPEDTNATYEPYIVITDELGEYEFKSLHAGNHNTREPYEYRAIVENLEGNQEVVDYQIGSDKTKDNDFTWLGSKETFTVVSESHLLVDFKDGHNPLIDTYEYYETVPVVNIDLGIYEHITKTVIGSKVFEDKNRDGKKNLFESGLSGVPVSLYRYNPTDGTKPEGPGVWELTKDLNGLDTIITDRKGDYEFEVEVTDLDKESKDFLMPYRYKVVVERESLAEFTEFQAEGVAEDKNSDVVNIVDINKGPDYLGLETKGMPKDIHLGVSRQALLVEDEVWSDGVGRVDFDTLVSDLDIDAGLYFNTNQAIINLNVFEDADENSIKDLNEKDLKDISVELYRYEGSAWKLLEEKITNKKGDVAFDVETANVDKDADNYLLPYRYKLVVNKDDDMLFSKMIEDVTVSIIKDPITGKIVEDTQGIDQSIHKAITAQNDIGDTHVWYDGIERAIFTEEVYETYEVSGISIHEFEKEIAGIVFEDILENGSMEDQETMKNIPVKLLRFNPVNPLDPQGDGEWMKFEDTLGNSTLTTKRDGSYKFIVPVANTDGESNDYLIPYRYKVVIDRPESSLTSKYKLTGVSEEFDSDVKDLINLVDGNRLEDTKGLEDDILSTISREAELNTLIKWADGIERIEMNKSSDDLDIGAGFTPYDTVEQISGIVWRDDQGLGIRDEDTELLSGYSAELYKYTPEDDTKPYGPGKWVLTSDLIGNDTVLTDSQGKYTFTVPTTETDALKESYLVPYRYKVVVNKNSNERSTLYKVSDTSDVYDSDVKDVYSYETGEVVLDDLNEIEYDFNTTLSREAKLSTSNVWESGRIVIDLSKTESDEHIDAGYLEFDTTVIISGQAWNDKNDDAIKQTKEDKLSGIEMSLYELINGEWIHTPDVNGIDTVKTDENGHYEFEVEIADFDHLSPTYLLAREYKIIAKKSPDQFFTEYKVAGSAETNDNDFKATKDTETNKDINNLAGINNEFDIGYSRDAEIVSSSDWTDGSQRIILDSSSDDLLIDLGIYAPSNEVIISGMVFNDLDSNGIKEDEELGVEGIEMKLYQYQPSVITDEQSVGKWLEVDSMNTGLDGLYEFTVEAYESMSDKENYLTPYRYKVVAIKGTSAIFSDYKVIEGREENDSDVKPMVDIADGSNPVSDYDGIEINADYGLSREAEILELNKWTDSTNRVNPRSLKNDPYIFAGLQDFSQTAIIAGEVWDDIEDIGVMNDDEDKIKNIKVNLVKYEPVNELDPQGDGKWVIAEDLDGISEIITKKDGKYEFTVPVANFNESDNDYLIPYRYKVIITRPDLLLPTDYKVERATESTDSDFKNIIDLNDGKEIEDVEGITKDKNILVSREAVISATTGWIDGTDRVSVKATQDDPYISLGLRSTSDKVNIAGTVFADLNSNGILEADEKGLSNKVVELYRFSPQDITNELGEGEWVLHDDQLTDGFGDYNFEVDAYESDTSLENYLTPYRYKVLVVKESNELFTDYKVAAATEETDSDVLSMRDVKTGEIVVEDYKGIEVSVSHGLSREADILDTITWADSTNKVDVYNTYDDLYVSAGIERYLQEVKIAGDVWQDVKDIGIMNDDEEKIKGIKVNLVKYEPVNELDPYGDGEWVITKDLKDLDEIITKKDGKYEFTVPATNFDERDSDYLIPYRYKIVITRPDLQIPTDYKVERASEETDSDFLNIIDLTTGEAISDVDGIDKDGNLVISREADLFETITWSDNIDHVEVRTIRDDLYVSLGLRETSDKVLIAGTVFADENSNGILEDNEKGLSYKEVELYRYNPEIITDEFSDGEWVLHDDQLTDGFGDYMFEVDAYESNPLADNYLTPYRYKVVVIKESDELFTEYKVVEATEETDSDVKPMIDINDGSIIVEDYNGIKLSDSNGLSREADILEVNTWNNSTNRVDVFNTYDDLYISAGIEKYLQEVKIAGNVWQDIEDLGIMDSEEERISEIKVNLAKYVPVNKLDPLGDGEWELVEDLNGVDEVLTDEEGYYEFIVNATNFNEYEEDYLIPYRYKVVITRPDLQIPTLYKVEEATEETDSDFLNIINIDTGEIISDVDGIDKDGNLVISREANLFDTIKWLDQLDRVEVKTIHDDVYISLGLIETSDKVIIAGTVFADINSNGILEADEKGLANKKVELYRYNPEDITNELGDGKWVLYKDKLTDGFGDYMFEVDAYESNPLADNYLTPYRYKVVVVKDSDELFTDYKVEEATEETDSDVKPMIDIKTGSIIVEDYEGIKENASHGLSREADILEVQEWIDSTNRVKVFETYDDLYISAGIEQFNQVVEIAGIVWEDVEDLGILDDEEKLVEGIKVNLVKYEPLDKLDPFGDGEWVITKDVNGFDQLITDENGAYNFTVQVANFDELDSDYLIPYRYKVLVDRPEASILSPYKVEEALEETDSDFLNMIDLETGEYLKDIEGIEESYTTGVSREALNTQSVEWDDGTKRILVKESVSDLHVSAGIRTMLTEVVIGDKVFADEDRTGLQDDETLGLEGINVHLLEMIDGDWVIAEDLLGNSKTTTDSDGEYRFLVAPAHYDSKEDTYLNEREYRVIVERPLESTWSDFKVGNDLEEIDSDIIAYLDDLELDSELFEGLSLVHDLGISRKFDIVDLVKWEEIEKIDMESSRNDLNVDAGLYKHNTEVVIGDTIWNDENRNNMFDTNEKGIEGIEVVLMKKDLATGEFIDYKDLNGNEKVITDTDGNYEFVVNALDLDRDSDYYLERNIFKIKYSIPEGYEFINNSLESDSFMVERIEEYVYSEEFEMYEDSLEDNGVFANFEGITERLDIDGSLTEIIVEVPVETSDIIARLNVFNLIMTSAALVLFVVKYRKE